MTVFLALFLLVTVLGFFAARWRRGDLNLLDEWGLAGRRFGTVISWFLIGGDLYTAYTFVAVPGLMFGAGAIGFFAVPYTILIYPLAFMILPRLWSVSKEKGYITASDFVKGRFDSRFLAFLIALTGIVATLPYIALQLVGMQAVLQTLGLTGTGIMADLPLIVAFAILAAYTYTSGLRAPAMVAVVKDLLIYITIIAAIIIIPAKLGGFAHIFQVANQTLAAAPKPASTLLSPKAFSAYATLALGSALALFFYPHSVTAVLATKDRGVIKRNAALLPLYSLLLGFIALLGYMAIAAGIQPPSPTYAVPLLFQKEFPAWFEGFAFAAILIGALVPAAIMSIAAANLFTRNIVKDLFNPKISHKAEATTAKWVSLVVKLGALIFVIGLPLQFAIYLQTLGGVLILQTLPTIVGGLYTRWFHRWALILGWLAGIGVGLAMEYSVGWTTSTYVLNVGSQAIAGYAGIWAIIVNLVVTVVISLILNAAKVTNGKDETAPKDYVAEGA